MSTNMDICNSLQTSLLLYESMNWKTAAYDEHHAIIYAVEDKFFSKQQQRDAAQHEKNKEIFEKGVRHGFWNVKTKEEIKEKYEKYKHLEDWYEP